MLLLVAFFIIPIGWIPLGMISDATNISIAKLFFGLILIFVSGGGIIGLIGATKIDEENDPGSYGVNLVQNKVEKDVEN